MQARGRIVALGGTLLFLAAGLVVGAMSATAGAGKSARDPEAGLTDAQRMAIHQAAHQQNDAYLKSFVARHGDPRTLPVIEVPSYAAPPLTQQAAVAASAVIATGTVRGTTFQSSPTGGMPLTTVTLAVERTLKGSAAPVMVVHQLGGPVAQGSGGALAELDTDQLLLPGDHVMVMLTQSSGVYRPLAGAGVNLIRPDGTLQAEDSNPFAVQVNGKSVTQMAATFAG